MNGHLWAEDFLSPSMPTTFVLSLLRALVSADGERLVLKPGEIPRIVTPRGSLVVATSALPERIVRGVLRMLLPLELLVALDDVGVIEYDLPLVEELAGERFTVIADDRAVVQVKRHRAEDALAVPAAAWLWPATAA